MKGNLIKGFCVVLGVLMCMTVLSAVTFAEDTTTQYDFSYLQNTYAKIMAGETVNIAYLGGSVTNGYAGVNNMFGGNEDCQGATDGRDCWREGTFKWFQSTFADTGAKFVENHAAIGGTGSDLNLYRAENALKLGTADAADLVFIEFGINDSYEGLSQAESAQYMEAIVRQIYDSDPYTDIVIIVVTDNGKTNTKYPNAAGHEEIALAYDIPILWIGADLYNYIANLEGGTNGKDANWYTYFADSCHPNVKGHAIYTQSIVDKFLVPNLTKEGLNLSTTKRTAKVMPNPVYDGGFWNSYEASVSSFYKNFSGYGFGSDGKYLYSNVGGGDSFNIRFYGTGFGLRYSASETNGLIQFNVDGGNYQAKDFRNPNSNGGTNHHMLVQGLDEGWHEMNVILRKTVSGSSLIIHGFFIDGDASEQPFTFGTPPTSAPNTEIFTAAIVLTPKLLDTNIEGPGYINDGSVRTIEVAVIDDVDTLSYVPNPNSSESIASDNYNDIRNVVIPEYKYATVGYHYDVPDGVTPSATRMMMNYLQLNKIGGSQSSMKSYSAQNGFKINESDELIFDITSLPLLGVNGAILQMHFYPMGNIKGSDGSAAEKMHIKNVIFHADYPYDTSPVAADLASAAVSGATVTADTKDGEAVTKLVASGKASLTITGLESLEMLPSVYNYVQVEYYAESGKGTPVLYIPTLDNGAFTAEASSSVSTGAWKKATFNLSDISGVNGQWNFYKDAVLYPYGEAESEGTMYIKSLKFYHAYPDPNAEFSIKFDINGGKGTAPSDLVAKIGSKVTLPSCSATKEGLMFAGWAETPDATEIITKYYMPENGATLYAVWIDKPVVFASAEDTTIFYEGVSNAVEYTTLSAALTALGTNGGTVVITGDLAFTDLNSIPSNCLGVEIIGANSTARLVGFNSNLGMKSPLSLENIILVKNADGSRYFIANGHKLVIGENVSYIQETTDATTGEVTSASVSVEYLATALNGDVEAVFSSDKMTYGVVGVGYTKSFNGNSTITINKGKFSQGIQMGMSYSSSFTVSGNATLIVNGGTFSNKNVSFTQYVANTGAKTIIYNNDMKSTGPNSTNFDYIIDSSIGGEVYISTQATATTAPTFTAKAAKEDYEILLGGESVGFGSYEFTPSAKGTYEITFVVPTYTVSFDANGGEGTAPAAITNIDGTVITLNTAPSITKEGCTFMGWSFSPDRWDFAPASYTIDGKSVTLYAAWAEQSVYYVNPNGSGKLTYNGIEHPAYTTLIEAADAIIAAGDKTPMVIFTGEVHTKVTVGETTSDFHEKFNGKGITKLIIKGTSTDTATLVQYQTVQIRCATEYRSMTIKPAAVYNATDNKWSDDVYTYCNGYEVIMGEAGVENDVVVEIGQYYSKYLQPIGYSTKTRTIINSGTITIICAKYEGNLDGNSYIEINGGTFKNAVNGGFLTFASKTYALNGNSTVVVNGGTHDKKQVVFSNVASSSGKKTVIFNNNMAATMTATDADYIIDNGTQGYVSELTPGKEFLVTPKANYLVPVVNGTEMTANEDGEYILAPTADGTYEITYKTLPSYSVSFDANGGTGTAPEAFRGLEGTVITLPGSSSLSNSGYTFCGWSETADHKVILGESYTIGNQNKTLYAVWQKSDTFYVNPDASGKLIMDGAEYIAPYASLNAAAEAIVSSGIKTPTIIFTGETHTKTEDVDFWSKLQSKGISKLILKGTSTATATLVQYQTQNIYCHTEYRSMTIVGATGDVYTYCNGYEVTYGEKGVENDVVVIQNSKYLQPIGYSTKTRTIINSGTFTTICAMYNSNLMGTSYIEINGGTFKNAVNGGFLYFGDDGKTFTLGNSTVVINGGTHEKNAVIFDKVGTCTGKRTAILNNNMADVITTVTGADYIIKSTSDGYVSELTTGKSFLIEPARESLIPYVNGTAMTANADGDYVLTPSENGTFTITYAELSDVTIEFVKVSTESAIVKTVEKDGFDYNSSAKISLYTEAGELIDSVLETEITEGTHTFEKILSGNYYVVIEKNGYLTYTTDVFSLTAGEPLPIDGIELIPGDIKGDYNDFSGDGIVDIDDFLRLLRAFGTDAQNQLRAITDINEDGVVTVDDLAHLKRGLGKTTDSYKENN